MFKKILRATGVDARSNGGSGVPAAVRRVTNPRSPWHARPAEVNEVLAAFKDPSTEPDIDDLLNSAVSVSELAQFFQLISRTKRR